MGLLSVGNNVINVHDWLPQTSLGTTFTSTAVTSSLRPQNDKMCMDLHDLLMSDGAMMRGHDAG